MRNAFCVASFHPSIPACAPSNTKDCELLTHKQSGVRKKHTVLLNTDSGYMFLQTELTPSAQWRLSDPVVSHGGPLLFLYEKKTWSCVTLLCFPFAAQYSSQFITYNDTHFNCYCKN